VRWTCPTSYITRMKTKHVMHTTNKFNPIVLSSHGTKHKSKWSINWHYLEIVSRRGKQQQVGWNPMLGSNLAKAMQTLLPSSRMTVNHVRMGRACSDKCNSRETSEWPVEMQGQGQTSNAELTSPNSFNRTDPAGHPNEPNGDWMMEASDTIPQPTSGTIPKPGIKWTTSLYSSVRKTC